MAHVLRAVESFKRQAVEEVTGVQLRHTMT
jgi:hypothetical protein